MFYKFRRKITERCHVKNSFYRVLAYCIAVFFVLQCYGLSYATEENEYLEEIATIGDATWTSAYPEEKTEAFDSEELIEETETVGSAVSDLYRVSPDTSNAFVAFAMSVGRGAGMYTDNQCAIYVASVLSNYYGEKAPVQNQTLVSQISKRLDASENWERVYADAACFPMGKTEAEFDAIFDSHTNAGDVVCFVNKSLDDYVHCAIAGGGNALVGHLYSSGWDCLRACYYIDNAVDTRKECSGMIVYRYKEKETSGTLRICKGYNQAIYMKNPGAYDIGGACYAVYESLTDAQAGKNAKGFCYIEPGEIGEAAHDNVSGNAREKPNGEGKVVQFKPGKVYIKEYSAPTGGGWKLDTTIYETKIVAGKRTTVGLPLDDRSNTLVLPSEGEYFDTQIIGPEQPELRELELQKKVHEYFLGMIGDNSSYDCTGIEYAVYMVGDNRVIDVSDRVGTFTMDADGKGIVSMCTLCPESVGQAAMSLPFGWYMLQETKANASMTLDTTPKWVHLTKENHNVQIETVYDAPWLSKADLVLRKYGEEGEAVSGAEYTISYYKKTVQAVSELEKRNPDRTWVFHTDMQGEIRYSDDSVWFLEGDDFYRDSDGQIVIPAGTLTFEEKTAPKGYQLDETVYIKAVVPGENPFLSLENVVTVIEEYEPVPPATPTEPEPEIPPATPTEPEPEIPPATPTEPEPEIPPATPTEHAPEVTEEPKVAGEHAIRNAETVVRTGDSSKLFVAILLACTAATGVFVLLYIKKKR